MFRSIIEMFVLSVMVLITPFCMAEEQTDSKIVSIGMQSVGECAMEANINYDLCLQMFEANVKHDDPKYEACKCMIPCIAKKTNLMTAEGKFKEDEILKVINDLKTPGFKEEGLKVYELCKGVEGTNCDAGFNMVKCVLTNSEKILDILPEGTLMQRRPKAPLQLSKLTEIPKAEAYFYRRSSSSMTNPGFYQQLIPIILCYNFIDLSIACFPILSKCFALRNIFQRNEQLL